MGVGPGTVGGRAYFVLPDGRTVPAAESRRHLCRYVMQDDRAMATETVEEALGERPALAPVEQDGEDERGVDGALGGKRDVPRAEKALPKSAKSNASAMDGMPTHLPPPRSSLPRSRYRT